MARFRAGLSALLTFGIVAACGKDPVAREIVGPEASADLSPSANHHGSGAQAISEPHYIAMKDDCDPHDAAWAATGGCFLRGGNVTNAEFVAENNSLLALSVVGHQAWRNDPSYLKITAGTRVLVANEGGRVHTFTEVAMFGGGKVPSPLLNKGLTIAPECPGSINVPPGGVLTLPGLTVGNHRFECCIHPWMRAIIKVKAA